MPIITGNSSSNTIITSTHIKLPVGNTLQRPASSNGLIRINSDSASLEFAFNNSWSQLTSFSASGGTKYTYITDGIQYTAHAFTSSGTFIVDSGSSQVDVMLVAGGGGGGGSTAGGGGAGGLIYQSYYANFGTYSVVIGSGGAGSQKSEDGPVNNTNGSNTTVFGYTAIGGGYGFSGKPSGSRLANSGGSGGGGGYYSGNDILNTTHSGSGTSGQGNRGGYGNDTVNWGGAGGGGAGGVGVDMISTRAGGAGLNMSSYFSTNYGVSGWFAGGGGGASYNTGGNTPGGQGGGGMGGTGMSSNATSGIINTGGGGGGSGFYQSGFNPSGGNGGSGIVIIRYVS